MTEWWYSQLIFIEKNHFYQQCTSYASAVRKSVGNAFSGNLETRISFSPPSLFTLGIPHGDTGLSKL